MRVSRIAFRTAHGEAPVTCQRYLSGRESQLNYREAMAERLLIGSDEIEGAHRYDAQKRLKLSGALWRIKNAE